MSSYSYVIRGKLQRKKIERPAAIGGHDHITPQKVKEAAFQIFENEGAFEQALFLDLYSGSGQMGIEALSRGARWAGFADLSAKRLYDIRLWLEKNAKTLSASFFKRDSNRLLPDFLLHPEKYLPEELIEPHKNLYIYADPPYPKSRDWNAYYHLLEKLNAPSSFRHTICIMQVPLKSADMKYFAENFDLYPLDFRFYGRHCLIISRFF